MISLKKCNQFKNDRKKKMRSQTKTVQIKQPWGNEKKLKESLELKC